ncbi:serine/arginine repetitive matrix protein 1-like [Eucalyptus grandis]|uniref:serine/arginine repetitive matrix protein 1-like n=1 Tax=Eucalyptus grandis TaxID=71139 RepID=UPI00192E911C|nr:serine/arginine repetitive matrix protein 1-like [Eucalyptus grandis]
MEVAEEEQRFGEDDEHRFSGLPTKLAATTPRRLELEASPVRRLDLPPHEPRRLPPFASAVSLQSLHPRRVCSDAAPTPRQRCCNHQPLHPHRPAPPLLLVPYLPPVSTDVQQHYRSSTLPAAVAGPPRPPSPRRSIRPVTAALSKTRQTRAARFPDVLPTHVARHPEAKQTRVAHCPRCPSPTPPRLLLSRDAAPTGSTPARRCSVPATSSPHRTPSRRPCSAPVREATFDSPLRRSLAAVFLSPEL